MNNKTGKVIGILAIVVAGISCIVPGGALLATFVGAPLVAFAWKEGSLFGYIAGGLNIINIVFLSPTVWMAMGMAEAAGSGGAMGIGIFYVSIQVIAMGIMWYMTNRKSKKKR